MAARDPIYALARRLRPELEQLPPPARIAPTGDLWGLVTITPLALVGIAWLVSLTSFDQLRAHWLLLLLTTGLIALLRRWSFYLVAALGVGTGTGYANANASFESVARWGAVLLLGPVGLWPEILITILSSLNSLRTPLNKDEKVNLARDTIFSLNSISLLALIALRLFQVWGGALPIQALDLRNVAAFTGVLAVYLIMQLTILVFAYLGYIVLAMLPHTGWLPLQPVVKMIVITIIMPYLAAPFAVLAASLYYLAGLSFYLLFFAGLLLAARMAHSLSHAVESNRQQSTQLQKLEALGRALLRAAPDGSQLSELLLTHVNGMFISINIAIWTDPQAPLLKRPPEWRADELPEIDAWLRAHPEPRTILAGQPVPWKDGQRAGFARALAPLIDEDSGQPVGGIYMDLQRLAVLDAGKAPYSIQLTLPTLAAQVSAALHRARLYEQTLAHQRTLQELSLARQIQRSFLPASPPQLPGWGIAASLEPARQVSGDFYDLIPLPGGRLGLLVADVADKGLGPALFMALSRTLIRTFAQEYAGAPEEALRLANERILQDVGDNLFVTVFYAVLDPQTGDLIYCNGGHNPPMLFHSQPPCTLELLTRTGIPLAVLEDATWTRSTAHLEPGDLLALYTDGVTDAQNEAGQFFEDAGLSSALEANLARSAIEAHAATTAALRQFCGRTTQADDITLVIVKREDPVLAA